MPWRGRTGQQLLRMQLLSELLGPFQGGWGHLATPHTGEDDGHQGRWDATLQRGSQHVVLDPALVEA